MSAVLETKPLCIDLGSGRHKREGFIGVDKLSFPEVDVVCDLASEKWPWEDDSVDEAHCSHFLEHLTNFNEKWERVHFFNELHRVMKKGAKCTLIMPSCFSGRFFGDPTHKEPFSEFGFFYLLKSWRVDNAPHVDYDQAPGPQSYTCDFDVTYGYSLYPGIQSRNNEYQMFALTYWKEAAQDIQACLTKR